MADDVSRRCRKRNRSWRCKEEAMDGRTLCEKHLRSYQNFLEKSRELRMPKAEGDSCAGVDVSMPSNDKDCVVFFVDGEDSGLFADACEGNGGGAASERVKREAVGVGNGNVVVDSQDGSVKEWCGGGGGDGVLPRVCGGQQKESGGKASGDEVRDGSASLPPKRGRGRPFGSKDKHPRKRRSHVSGEFICSDDVGRAEAKNGGDMGVIAPKKRGRPLGRKNSKRENVEAMKEGKSGNIVGGGSGLVLMKKRGRPIGSKNKKKLGRPSGSKHRKKRSPNDGNVGTEEENVDNG